MEISSSSKYSLGQTPPSVSMNVNPVKYVISFPLSYLNIFQIKTILGEPVNFKPCQSVNQSVGQLCLFLI